jgi:hypothetical protein
MADGTAIYVPYNIVFAFAVTPTVADATTYYDSWTMATTCTNK